MTPFNTQTSIGTKEANYWGSYPYEIEENYYSGVVLLEENGRHILLLHAHDQTEELVPRYYQKFLDFLLEKGVVFEAPQFLCDRP